MKLSFDNFKRRLVEDDILLYLASEYNDLLHRTSVSNCIHPSDDYQQKKREREEADMDDEFNSNTTTCNLFGEFYHKSFFAWKILVFEFYLTWLRTEVPGVEDDIAAGVETSNVD